MLVLVLVLEKLKSIQNNRLLRTLESRNMASDIDYIRKLPFEHEYHFIEHEHEHEYFSSLIFLG